MLLVLVYKFSLHCPYSRHRFISMWKAQALAGVEFTKLTTARYIIGQLLSLIIRTAPKLAGIFVLMNIHSWIICCAHLRFQTRKTEASSGTSALGRIAVSVWRLIVYISKYEASRLSERRAYFLIAMNMHYSKVSDISYMVTELRLCRSSSNLLRAQATFGNLVETSRLFVKREGIGNHPLSRWSVNTETDF